MRPSAIRMTMYPPPPMLPASGNTTGSSKLSFMRVLESYAKSGSELEEARCGRARAIRWMENEVGHFADVNIADLRQAVPQPAAEAKREVIFARRAKRRLGRAVS